MPIAAIHKCTNNKWRIGSGDCKFDSKQLAINAFEHWIKTKTKDAYQSLFQIIDENEFKLLSEIQDLADDIDIDNRIICKNCN